MYSIVTISGKQYCVSEGDTIKVSSQDWKVGDRVKLDQVLLTDNGKNIEVGTPKVNGASVTVEILEHNREKKLLIYKKLNITANNPDIEFRLLATLHKP